MSSRSSVRNRLKPDDPYYHSKTRLQWLAEGRAVNGNAEGLELWSNRNCQVLAVYFRPEDTHEASPEEIEAYKEEQRAKRRDRYRKQKDAEKAAEAAERARVDRLMVRLHRYRDVDPTKTICLDVETTGLDAQSDEILQLSIIDGAGAVLFNEYIRPQRVTEWPEAAAINGITPEMVAKKTTIAAHLAKIQEIIDSADLIIGYNSNGFDIPFLCAAGVTIPREKPKFDVMLEFAEIYGEWDEYHRSWRWQKLATCADFFFYMGSENYHDSLEDAQVTLYCYDRMKGSEIDDDGMRVWY